MRSAYSVPTTSPPSRSKNPATAASKASPPAPRTGVCEWTHRESASSPSEKTAAWQHRAPTTSAAEYPLRRQSPMPTACASVSSTSTTPFAARLHPHWTAASARTRRLYVVAQEGTESTARGRTNFPPAHAFFKRKPSTASRTLGSQPPKPWASGRTATILSGTRSSAFHASPPTARMRMVCACSMIAEGSRKTTPRPDTPTTAFAAPTSITTIFPIPIDILYTLAYLGNWQ